MWDLQSAIRAGAEHLTRSFDRDRDDLPWFEVRLQENVPGTMFHFDSLDLPHAPGRALDAMLNAECVTDFRTPEEVIEKYKKAIRASLDGDDRLPGV